LKVEVEDVAQKERSRVKTATPQGEVVAAWLAAALLVTTTVYGLTTTAPAVTTVDPTMTAATCSPTEYTEMLNQRL
jgi:hypothetical protein